VEAILAIALILFFATVNGVVAGVTAGFLRGAGKLRYTLLVGSAWIGVCLLYFAIQVHLVPGERRLLLVLASCLLASLTFVLLMAIVVFTARRR
jgi:hypothetical protein